MGKPLFSKKSLSLRTFITITVSLIVFVVLLCSIPSFYYNKETSRILRDHPQGIYHTAAQSGKYKNYRSD